MIKQSATWHQYFTCIFGLCLGLALQADAQQRGGGTGGGFGGGGFGGGGGSRSSTGTSAGSTTRQYPNNTTIGDAYFSIDPETHRVVYIADEATAKYIRQVLTNLDRPKPQVLIKVVFIEVSRNNGLDFGVEGSFNKNIGNSWNSGLFTTNFAVLPSYSTLGTNNTIIQSGASIIPSSIVPTTSSSFISGTNLSTLTGLTGGSGLYQILGQDYQVTLHAIATAGNAKILSRPSIIARNNQPATITVGQQVPLITGVTYDNFGNSHDAITYKDVGVILKVTPFITEDGLVQMMVSPQISSIDATTSIPISTSASGATINAPVIDIRSADTVVVTPDGQTVIIGGLIQNSKAENESKVPFLGDIPLLGNFFKRKVTTDSKSELIIFLTPHIIPAPSQFASLSATERARSDAVKALSEKELDKFLDTLPAKKDSKNKTKKPAKNTFSPPPVSPN